MIEKIESGDRLAVGRNNENSDDIMSTCSYSLTRDLCYAMHFACLYL